MPEAPASSSGTGVPADLERRFAAFAIDRGLGWALAFGVAAALTRVAGGGLGLLLLAALATAVLLGAVLGVVVGITGSSPGRAALGLRLVRRVDGRPIGAAAGLARAAVLGMAGWPTVGLGLATLAWTALADPEHRRRGLHDRIGDAITLDVRARAVEPVDDRVDAPSIVNLTAMRLLPSPAPDLAPVVAAPAAPAAPPPPSPPSPAVAPVVAPVDEQTRVRGAAPVTAPAPAPAPAAPAPTWRVVFDTGEAFVVEGLALVGRRPEARPGEPVRHLVPLSSGDMSVSKTHAQFQVAPDGALVVMDRGSTNGSSIVRGGVAKPLAPGRPSTLLAGDVVRFGDRTMAVERA